MTTAILESPATTEAPPRTDVLEIVVSHDDIRDGVQGDSSQCAVALAVKRAGHRRVTVDGVFLTIVDGVIYQLPPELREWIHTFDHDRRGVHPDRWVLSQRDQGGAA